MQPARALLELQMTHRATPGRAYSSFSPGLGHKLSKLMPLTDPLVG